MTFNSSCSYACLGHLLEQVGIDRTDREIALELGLPDLFAYDSGEDAFLAGAMLQGKRYYDWYLGTLGYQFRERELPREQAVSCLRDHTPCMVGMDQPGWAGKHAVVCEAVQADRLSFRSPHREGDGQPDRVTLTEQALLQGLEPVCYIGWLEPTGVYREVPRQAFEQSVQALEECRQRLAAFCGERRSASEIRAVRDRLFRPLAVDGLAMAELAGREALAGLLKEYQGQVMELFRAGDCTPAEHTDLTLLNRAVDQWKACITGGKR